MPNTRIYWLHALSPTHAGIGRGVGYIDLPIDRDGVTGWPIVRGSAFKGVWADPHRKHARKIPSGQSYLQAAFGIADDDNSNSGALIPTDATLVCLPVRSFRGTFAWCTSPLCLQMLRRTLELAGVKGLPEAPSNLAEDRGSPFRGTRTEDSRLRKATGSTSKTWTSRQGLADCDEVGHADRRLGVSGG